MSGSAESTSSLDEEEREMRLDFWRIYDAHYDAVSQSMATMFAADPKLCRIFDQRGVYSVREETRALVRRALDGDWSAYEARLRASAVDYARVGLTFEGWYVLTVCLADVITPHMIAAYGGEPRRLTGALQAMRRFLDRVRVMLTNEFIAAKERAIAESERRMRALAGRLQTAIEEERRRMAREIHDELGQQLTALKLDHAWVLRRFETRDRSQVRELLADMDHLLDTTVETVRRLATNLRPPILDELGLVAAIEWQVREVEARSGIRFDVTLPDDAIDAPDERSTSIFRIFQEILTNVVRHARARNVIVRLEVDEGTIMLEVRDDGRGITPAEAGGGMSLGLVGIRERAALLGGQIDIDGAPGRGTSVQVRVPVQGGAPA